MSCSGEGQPKPSISWRRAGGQKMPKDRVVVDQGNLTIKQLKKEDHGKYECVLENEVATLVASTILRLDSTTPHAPTNVSVNSSAFSASISWQPSHDGGYEQTYIIWYRMTGDQATDADWKTIKVYPEGSTTFTLYNLQQDTEYEFQVYSRNILGDGLPSPVIRARTKAWTYTDPNSPVLPTDGYGSTYIPPIQKSKEKKPGVPRNVTVQRVAQGYVISWLPPHVTSDSVPVAYYYVEYRVPPSEQWSQFGPISKENSFLARNLKPGTYILRVLAYSLLGAGQPTPQYEFEVPGGGTKTSKDKAIAAGVVGGILFFVAAIVLSVCAVKICNKRKRRKAEKGMQIYCHVFSSNSLSLPLC